MTIFNDILSSLRNHHRHASSRFQFREHELSTLSALSESDCVENADSSDFSEYGFCSFWDFCETKGVKSSKDRFLQSSEHELCAFSAFCSCKVCKMRKVQIPHNAGSMINPNRYGFVDFLSVAP